MLEKFWMGSEDSYDHAVAVLESLSKFKTEKLSASAGVIVDEEDLLSPYLNIVDGVGIVSIVGSLIDGSYGELGLIFGVTGYGDIQKALTDAVSNPAVNSIMLMVKSGGGAVSGVSETAKFIQTVDKIKPVITYSNSMMASAALWLGLSARKSYVSDTAIAGSIGTVRVLYSDYRQMQAEGVDAVVVRSGKYKALGGGMEPISDLVIAETQKDIDYLADLFLTYVAERRGVNKVSADSLFGQGRTFIGKQVVDVGLVDAVLSYNQAFLTTKSLNSTDKSNRFFGATITGGDNSVDNSTMQKENDMHIPTPEQLAAMAAGIEITEQKSEDAPTETDDSSKDAEGSSAEQAKTLEDTSAKLSQTLIDLSAASAKVSELEAKLESQEETLAGFSEIVRAGVKAMSLPFNLDTGSLAEIGGKELIAKHKEVSTLVKDKIKAGTVSVSAKETKPKESAIAPAFAEQALSLPGAN